MDLPDEQRACLACGMCCDGVLFTSAKLPTWRRRKWQDLGFEVLFRARAGDWSFSLPCAHHSQDSGCTRYDQEKPAICGEYRCKMLKGLSAGVVRIDDALEHIARTRAVAAKVKALLEPRYPEIPGLRARIERYGAEVQAGGELPSEELIGAVQELAALVSSGFLYPHQMLPSGGVVADDGNSG